MLSEWAIPELASVPNATEVDCDRLSNSSETEADYDLNSARLLRVRTRRGRHTGVKRCPSISAKSTRP